MSDNDFSTGHLSNNRDWRFPVPLTGRPERKKIYDWNRRCWIICTCILLGVREIPNSVPYAQRPGNEAASDKRNGQAPVHCPDRNRLFVQLPSQDAIIKGDRSKWSELADRLFV